MQQDVVIEAGDTVVLRSGGPEMTVVTRSQSLAYCTWEDEDGQSRTGTFEVEALRPGTEAAAQALLRQTPMPGSAPLSALPSDGELAPAPPETKS